MRQVWNPYDFAMHNIPHLYRKIDMSSFALVIIACVNSPIQLEGIWTPMPFLRQEWTSNIIACNHFIIFICNYCLLSSTFLFLKFIFSSALLSVIGLLIYLWLCILYKVCRKIVLYSDNERSTINHKHKRIIYNIRLVWSFNWISMQLEIYSLHNYKVVWSNKYSTTIIKD